MVAYSDQKLMAKKDEKKKTDWAKVRDVSLASTIPFVADPIVRKGLGRVALAPAHPSERAITSKLLEAAREKGIEFRRGKTPAAESYVFPKKVDRILERAAKNGIELSVFTPEGNIPLESVRGKKIVWLDKGVNTNPAIVAHELGHLPKKPRHPDWNHIKITIPKIVAPVAALAVASIGAAKAETPEGARKAGILGGLIGAIGSLPMLHEEARASFRGMKMMRESGATKRQAKILGAKRMLPAFGTYTMMAGAPALAAYLIGRAVAKHKKKKK